MRPYVKVLIVVAVVLVVVHVLKAYTHGTSGTDTFVDFPPMEFQTVPPQPHFVVTPVPLVVSGDVTTPPVPMTPPPVLAQRVSTPPTLMPVLTEVATQLPSAAPTMVPTYVPSAVPGMVPTVIPTLVTTRAP
jgi:hypothetical protein